MLACMGEVAAPICVVIQDYHKFFKGHYYPRKVQKHVNDSKINIQCTHSISITCIITIAFIIGLECYVVAITYSCPEIVSLDSASSFFSYPLDGCYVSAS
jgi:hypothetical protein